MFPLDLFQCLLAAVCKHTEHDPAPSMFPLSSAVGVRQVDGSSALPRFMCHAPCTGLSPLPLGEVSAPSSGGHGILCLDLIGQNSDDSRNP